MIITPITELNLQASKNKFLNLTFQMKENIKSVVNAESSVFNNSVETFNEDLRTNLIDGTIGDALKILFVDYDAVASIAFDRVTLHTRLFDFGDDDDISEVATFQIEDAATTNALVQVYSLSFAYLASSQVDFDNNDLLLENVRVLNEQFIKVDDGTMDRQFRVELVDMKTLYLQFLSQVDVAQVIEIDLKTKTPATVITYQLYESLDNLDKIIGLNDFLFTGYMEGTIKVLSPC